MNIVNFTVEKFLNEEVNSEEKVEAGEVVLKLTKWPEFVQEVVINQFCNFIPHLVYVIQLKDFEVCKVAMKIAGQLTASDRAISILVESGFIEALYDISYPYEFRALYNLLTSDYCEKVGDHNTWNKILVCLDYRPSKLLIEEICDLIVLLSAKEDFSTINFMMERQLLSKLGSILEDTTDPEIQYNVLNGVKTIIQATGEEYESQFYEYGLEKVIENILDNTKNCEIEAKGFEIFNLIIDEQEPLYKH